MQAIVESPLYGGNGGFSRAVLVGSLIRIVAGVGGSSMQCDAEPSVPRSRFQPPKLTRRKEVQEPKTDLGGPLPEAEQSVRLRSTR
jgi:hypothetical protein